MKSQDNQRNPRIVMLVSVIMIAFLAVSVEGAFNISQAFNWKAKKGKERCLISKKDQQTPVRFSQAISCGDTIESGQKVRLTRDLNCAGTGSAAITINGPAVLDLNGHTISGDDTMNGIVVQGEKAKIKNGKVSGFLRGVFLKGRGIEGHHRIFKILADENFVGFFVESNSNVLVKNLAKSSEYGAFMIYGDQNKIKSNNANANVSDGFTIRGAENRIVHNISKNNENTGMEIDGEKNFVAKNKSMNNSGVGIEVDGDENQIKRNIIKHNGGAGIDIEVSADYNVVVQNIAKGNNTNDFDDAYDVQDLNAECADNKWGNNRFGTCSQDCIN